MAAGGASPGGNTFSRTDVGPALPLPEGGKKALGEIDGGGGSASPPLRDGEEMVPEGGAMLEKSSPLKSSACG